MEQDLQYLPKELYVGKAAYQSRLADGTRDVQITTGIPKPYRIIHILERLPGFFISPHAHRFYQLLFVTDGATEVVLDEETLMAGSGDCVVLPPYCRHELRTDAGYRQIAVDVLVMDDKRGVSRLVRDRLGDSAAVLPAGGEQSFDEVFSMAQSGAGLDRLWVVNAVERLIFQLLESVGEEKNRAFRREFLLAMDEIDPGCAKLDELAAKLFMSRAKLERLCAAEFGCGGREYCNRVRLSRCCLLLQRTELPLEEIAQQLRFYDASHLCVFFRRRMGMTPGAYRSQMGEGGANPRQA